MAMKMSKTVDSSSLVPWAPVEVEDQVECKVEKAQVEAQAEDQVGVEDQVEDEVEARVTCSRRSERARTVR